MNSIKNENGTPVARGATGKVVYQRHEEARTYVGGWLKRRAYFAHTDRLIGILESTWTSSSSCVASSTCMSVTVCEDDAEGMACLTARADEELSVHSPRSSPEKERSENDVVARVDVDYFNRKHVMAQLNTKLCASTICAPLVIVSYVDDFHALSSDTLFGEVAGAGVDECHLVLLPHAVVGGQCTHPSSLWVRYKYATASAWVDLVPWVQGGVQEPLVVQIPGGGQPVTRKRNIEDNQIVVPVGAEMVQRLRAVVHRAASADRFEVSLAIERPHSGIAGRDTWSVMLRYAEHRRDDSSGGEKVSLSYKVYWTCPSDSSRATGPDKDRIRKRVHL